MESLILYDLFKQYGIQDTLPKIQKYVDWNKLINIIESPIIIIKTKPVYEDYPITVNEIRELIRERYQHKIKEAYQFYKKWFCDYDIEKYEIYFDIFPWTYSSDGKYYMSGIVNIKYLNGWHGVDFYFPCSSAPDKPITENTNSFLTYYSDSDETDNDDSDETDNDDSDDDQIS